MTMTTGDLKKGVVIELDDTLLQVVDWEHIKTGRGSAQVRLKLRDLRAGHTIEKTFQAGSKFLRVRIERTVMQYLYAEGGLHYFMNTENYEQMPISAELIGEGLHYLAENAEVDVISTATSRWGSSCRPPWSCASPRASRASRATRPRRCSSPPRWRAGSWCRCRSSWGRGT